MVEEASNRNIFTFPEGAEGKHAGDEGDWIRRNSPSRLNDSVDERIRENVRFYGIQSRETLSHRIRALDMEWDLERATGFSAAACALLGLVFGLLRGRLWTFLAWAAVGALLQFELMGWSRPVLYLRRLGFRTRREIGEEKYALKALRGDFGRISPIGEESETLARAANAAVSAVRA